MRKRQKSRAQPLLAQIGEAATDRWQMLKVLFITALGIYTTHELARFRSVLIIVLGSSAGGYTSSFKKLSSRGSTEKFAQNWQLKSI